MTKDHMQTLSFVAVFGVALYYVPKILKAMVPQIVQDGAEAGAVLTENAFHMVTDPLDAFGITPNNYPGTTTPTWTPTVPWQEPDNPLAGTEDTPSYLYF